jgi:predicted dehydrogenase
MQYGILGGGFGMYGYLPAIAGLEPERIVTLEKYRDFIRSRPELADFERRVFFVREPEMLFDQCDTIVVSQRPSDQEKIVDETLATGWKGTLVLEKPLARNPVVALLMLEKLAAAQMKFAVGFTISETDWAKKLAAVFRRFQPSDIHFNWQFLAHHYKHNLAGWKRQVGEGGGALRFFGVHLLALLAELGDWSAIQCSPQNAADEDPSFTCSAQTSVCRAEINCDSRWQGSSSFMVTVKRGGEILFSHHSSNPFTNAAADTTNQPGNLDSRITFLHKLLERAAKGPIPQPCDYKRHLHLWQDLEILRSKKTHLHP